MPDSFRHKRLSKFEVKADYEQKLGNELRKAVKSCNSDRVIELIREGADPNATDSFRTTALHMAAKMGHKEIVLLLLEAGADKSVQNSDGFTPVNLSQQNGRREVTEILANWDV
jgi:ankyrin repeat protein